MNTQILDLTGQTFSRLTVVCRSAADKNHRPAWDCLCSCGSTVSVASGHLRSGNVRSCGCLALEVAKETATKHGKSYSRTYKSWSQMLYRCSATQGRDYENYGGRGIKVCERWHTFENFLADMGERPEGKTLDRRENYGNYEPGNCRWATPLEQSENRRNSRLFEHEGKKQTLARWAKEAGVPLTSLKRAVVERGEPLGNFI